MKIVGKTVGTTIPKPDLSQTDPKKGDYVHGKDNVDTLSVKNLRFRDRHGNNKIEAYWAGEIADENGLPTVQVLSLYGSDGDEPVIVRNVADGVEDWDGATVGQVRRLVESSGVYYNAADYGVLPGNEDNTPALQALVDQVAEAGGGVIWIPVGEYRFRRNPEPYVTASGMESWYAVEIKSGVALLGESMTGTVLRQADDVPYSMFPGRGTADAPITGVRMERLTIDAYDTGDVNAVYGKAISGQYFQDCTYRDLILRGTTATALGIDYLRNVRIDRVYVLDCGRTYTGSENGTSGIGIGTGGWENENFTVSNCIAVGCGQYGIFIENQYNLGWGGNVAYSKGAIIANCIVRNGLHRGIGIRGGQNVTVANCEIYENAHDGIRVDGKCKNVHIVSCSSTQNGKCGIRLAPDSENERIAVHGCYFTGNTAYGILLDKACNKLVIRDCHTDGNRSGINIPNFELNDCVLLKNVFMDNMEISATFTGDTQYVDCVDSNAYYQRYVEAVLAALPTWTGGAY